MTVLKARPGALGESGQVLAEKRAFLESGAAWPGEAPVECIETHASLVFLTPDRVWKLKKSVFLPHIDLRTLEAREHYCREELRLNRELAGDIYHGVTPLVERSGGGLALGGPGRVVDWLIEIARLPSAAMLDRRLAEGPTPRPPEIEALCDLMISFYQGRQSWPDAGDRYYDRLLKQSRINADHLVEMQQHLGSELQPEMLASGISGIEACRDEILARGVEGIIVEGHGDLRPEHVCLTEPPVVFDRVEFDHGFRLIDPYDEFNGLGYDCALSGAGWIRDLLLFRLADSGSAPPSEALLKAYGMNRYLTRARLAIDHLRDAEIRTPRKWPAQARSFLAVAGAVFRQEAPIADSEQRWRH
jgi:aminoglycoside phosphotransferase family enzyme